MAISSVLLRFGGLLYLGFIVYHAARTISTALTKRKHRNKLSQRHECQPIQTKFPHKDPLFGLDLSIDNVVAARHHCLLDTINRRHEEVGDTYQLNMLGTVGECILSNITTTPSDLYLLYLCPGIMTRDPEIIKSVLSTNFKDYSLQIERKKGLRPLLGNGIFATDGPAWAHSRAILRPQFTRAQLIDLPMLEKHIGRLFDLVPPDTQEIELQELMLRFTMDVATELLFGESTNGLLAGRAEPYGQRVLTGFAESVQYAQDKTAMHMALGWWASLKPDRQFRRDVQVVHRFIDGFVEKALREHRADIKRESYVLLHALVDTVKDPVQIRDELITILIAGRDTTASLISNVFFLLARRPDIWEKLREDVQRQFQDRLPTFEEIPQCKYVRYTINECKFKHLLWHFPRPRRGTHSLTIVHRSALRLYPPVPLNSRVAVRDTVIPRGGGPEGKSPILVKEGMPIVYNVSGLHRRNDIYGKDVEEFRPERWEFLRVGWEFLPFSGGPRICIGRESTLSRRSLRDFKKEQLKFHTEQFAVTEASYVLIRFLQSFESIQCTDPRPWQEKVSLTFSSLNGVRVSFKRGS